jgi:hypothetical protein
VSAAGAQSSPHGRLAAASLCVVAGALPVWWVALYASEAARGLFVRPDEWRVLRPFLYADLGLAIVTGIAGARGLRGGLSGALAGMSVGGWGYATLWTVGASVAGSLSALGTLVMLIAFVVVCLACHALVSSRRAVDR